MARYFNLLFAFFIASCSDYSGETFGNGRSPDYKPLVEELHKLECDNLAILGETMADTELYAFRSAAFQAVLKNLDRTVLVRYEDLFQELARIEHGMSESEKQEYDEYLHHLYASGCK